MVIHNFANLLGNHEQVTVIDTVLDPKRKKWLKRLMLGLNDWRRIVRSPGNRCLK